MKAKVLIPIVAGALLFTGCSNDKETASKPTKTEQTQQEKTALNKVSIKNVGDKRLEVKTTAEGKDLKYAYSVYKDGKLFQKIPYSSKKELAYKLTKSGDYRVRVYVKAGKEKAVAKSTELVKVKKS
ncbi:triple tyrosine motif-containing protein [Priestia sp. TSO9]|uniref:triple tyrosine motif-containing protein n=1 Tax=Priestia sp. TSO9 TaxID=2885632 RepID=UPI001E3CC939|nr:triple tyrosine motif-containing protein [Priestia sp. TSO9]